MTMVVYQTGYNTSERLQTIYKYLHGLWYYPKSYGFIYSSDQVIIAQFDEFERYGSHTV